MLLTLLLIYLCSITFKCWLPLYWCGWWCSITHIGEKHCWLDLVILASWVFLKLAWSNTLLNFCLLSLLGVDEFKLCSAWELILCNFDQNYQAIGWLADNILLKAFLHNYLAWSIWFILDLTGFRKTISSRDSTYLCSQKFLWSY